MLRGECGRYRNIKGEPLIFGRRPSARQRQHFPLVVVFMMGFGEPQQHGKF